VIEEQIDIIIPAVDGDSFMSGQKRKVAAALQRYSLPDAFRNGIWQAIQKIGIYKKNGPTFYSFPSRSRSLIIVTYLTRYEFALINIMATRLNYH